MSWLGLGGQEQLIFLRGVISILAQWWHAKKKKGATYWKKRVKCMIYLNENRLFKIGLWKYI
jgi:hypothetical protein